MFGNRLVFGFTDDYVTQLTVPSQRSSRRLNYKSKIKAKRQTKLQVPVAQMLMLTAYLSTTWTNECASVPCRQHVCLHRYGIHSHPTALENFYGTQVKNIGQHMKIYDL